MPSTTGYSEKAIGKDAAAVEHEGHFDEGLDVPGRCAKWACDRTSKLSDRQSTASRAEVARRSCSSAPLIPDVESNAQRLQECSSAMTAPNQR